jgi:hypothetical protein
MKERKKKTTYMIIPGLVFVIDHSSTKAPSRVDASTSDWYCGKVNHEYCKSNWKGSQYLYILSKIMNIY